MGSSIATTHKAATFARINPMTTPYLETAPERAQIDALPGATVLEFGTNWCSVCRAAQPAITQALDGQAIRHIKVEDGSGRKLGRSFGVKLWPTLDLPERRRRGRARGTPPPGAGGERRAVTHPARLIKRGHRGGACGNPPTQSAYSPLLLSA
jgi:thioredoxin 1